MRVRLTILCFMTLVLFINTAWAQSPNGTVSGIVLDPSAAVIIGADVLIINNETGVQYQGKANSEGYYVVPNIPPGMYRIQVSNSGFKTIIKPDIVIHVEDALAINFTLPIGAASEVVTVEGGAPLINTLSAAVSTVIDRNFVENLPLNGRSFNTLLQLTPGVVIAPTVSGYSSGQFSIAGQRQDANNFTVDGVSANFGIGPGFGVGPTGTGNSQAFSALGGTSSLVSVEALQEFRIETSSFAPEFGRNTGGQVVLNTRSGTNDIHGGIYEYFRNDVLDANDWFANSAGKPRAAERHNDFGGFLGGPVWKDKTFFFVSYEGARLRLPQTTIIQVPSEYARSNAPTDVAPYLNGFPQPDDRAVTPGIYTSPFTGSYSNSATLNVGSIRVDHTFNQKVSIFGRYSDAPSETLSRSNGLSEVDFTDVNTRTFTLGINMVLSPEVFNTVRGNYSTQDSSLNPTLDSFSGAVPPPSSLFLGSLSPVDNAGAFVTFDTQSYSIGSFGRNRTRQANFVDNLSVAIGRHQLRFGGDYRAIFLDRSPSTHQTIFIASSVEQFVDSGDAFLLLAKSQRPTQILAQSVSVYGQDTARITRRLTVTYGARWELAPAPSGRGNTSLASWTNTSDPSQIALAQTGTPLWNTTYGNLAPRIGIAYVLDSAGTFVLRSGGGIFYDLGTGDAADSALYFPNGASSDRLNVPLPVSNITTFLPPFPSLQPPYGSNIFAYSPNLKLPRSYQWNVALEKSFEGSQAISATYLGQAGRGLTRQQAMFQPNPNIRSEFLLTQNNAWSNYDALQVQYRRRMMARVQALVSYTWSHSLDNVSNDVVAGLSNTVISAANDYASSSFDVRHSVSGAMALDFPSVARYRPLSLITKNWSLDTVIVARSGLPFNAVVLSTSPDPAGFATSRPDRVPGQPLYLFGASCVQVLGPPCGGGKGLNPAAFSIPSTVRQGTESRNDIPGFGLTQVDLSIVRKFAITERLNLQFRTDAFNVFNHPNFTNPAGQIQAGSTFLKSQSMLDNGLGGLNPLFQEGGPRSLQLSLKLAF